MSGTEQGQPRPRLTANDPGATLFAQFASLLDTSDEAIFILTPDRCFAYVNDNAITLTGRTRDALLGHALWATFPELVGTTLYHQVEEAFANMGNHEFGIEIALRGRVLLGRSQTTAAGVTIALRDVTARREAAAAREEARAQMVAERARLDAILEQLPVGVLLADYPSGELLFQNAEATRLLGHPLRSAAGPDDYDRYGAVHLDGAPYRPEEYPLARAVSQGESIRGEEMRYRRDDGTTTYLSVDAALVVADDTPIAAVTSFQDIAARKRAEDSLRFLSGASADLAESLDYEDTLARVTRLAVPYLADWCFADLLVAEGRTERFAVAHADPALAALAQEARRFPAEAVGNRAHAPSQALRASTAILIPDYTEAILRAAARNADHLRVSSAMHLRSVMVVPLVARGRSLGVLTFATAAESGRRFGPEQLSIAEELARRCALALDNARLYRQAQEALALRDQFVAIASHELRNPVTGAKGFLELLERQLAREEPDTARIARYIAQVHGTLDRMEGLVADLLDVSRIQQGRLDLQLEPCDLTALGAAILARLESGGEWTGTHTVTFDAPEQVVGSWDYARLDQVLTNLVSNALNYSPQGGNVRVAIAWDRTVTPPLATITVSDQGLGIPEAERETIFQPFSRGSARGTTIGGTGLGLYIVRQIVEGHGGTITVDSALGKGSIFTVRLPARSVPGVGA
jgi:PAS domain S-box-containing protein